MSTYLPAAFVFLAVALLISFYRGPGRKPLLLAYAAAMFVMAGIQFMAIREQNAVGAELADITAQVDQIKADIQSNRVYTKEELATRRAKLEALDGRLKALRR